MSKSSPASPFPTFPQVNSAFHPSAVAKSSTSFGWGKGGNFTSVGLQVTLCDPIWHVSSRSGVATLRTAIHLLITYLSIDGTDRQTDGQDRRTPYRYIDAHRCNRAAPITKDNRKRCQTAKPTVQRSPV